MIFLIYIVPDFHTSGNIWPMMFLFLDASIYYTLIIKTHQRLSDLSYYLHLKQHMLFIVGVADSVGHMLSRWLYAMYYHT